MKILIAAGMYPPDIGGPATYTKLLAERLPLIARNDSNSKMSVAVETFGSVRHLPKFVRHLAYFLRLIWSGRDADIIFAQDTVSVGLPALCAAFLLGRIFMVRVPGDYAWEQSVQRFGVTDGIDDFQNKKYGWRVEFLRRIQKLVVGSADAAIAPSRYFAQLVSGWVNNPSKVLAIYNGIDLSEAEAARASAFKRNTIISAGRLVPWKGFDMLIRAMKKLPDWKLGIAGDGPDMKRLAELVGNENLESQVTLLGSLGKDDLLKKIAQSEVFALNTAFESFSFLIVEAMALGTPVIATRVGNLAEIIDDGTNGILIEQGNEAQFLAAVRRVTASNSVRQNFSTEAIKKAQVFSIEVTAKAVRDVASRLITGQSIVDYSSEPASIKSHSADYQLPMTNGHARANQFADRRFFIAKIVRYLFSGGTAAVVDIVLLYILTSVCHLWYVISSILAFLIAFMVSFVLQKFFTFQDNAMEKVRGQALIYFVITAVNLLLNTALVYGFVEYVHLNYLIAQIAASIVIAVESYIIYGMFIFKKKNP